MTTFSLYPQAWIAYIALGLVLLFLLDLKLRKTHFAIRASLLTLIATGAFTPEIVRDSETYAPLLLTSLFNAELDGISAIYQGLITLLIVWGILLSLVLAIRHFIFVGKSKQEPRTSHEKTKDN
ncbi:hypothetical protein [Aliikangiella sp. G2MR2-5]|uniref:hypothetical protein n=1 Tax=Aliikangiella sp. G2MR2-5 TaxID=2788943 RepID=UPI0018A9F911|nr:hypothetical protein [Aliikangiella sp. G2MR2-5]